MYTHQPKRHPLNPKLRLHYEHTFHGAPVFQHPAAPLVTNYLETTWRVLHDALDARLRTLAIRLDLRFPQRMPAGPMHADNACLSRFFTALQRELKAAHTRYQPDLRYVWCREQNNSDKPHYHLLLLLNYDAFRLLGHFAPCADGQYHQPNLYHRCVRSWQDAIGMHGQSMQGLVNVAQDQLTRAYGVHRLDRGDIEAFRTVFCISSYLCKLYSKPVGTGVRGFGSSQ
ncbi:YagK/YfjJ domain-containing protein [Vreelandella jeotgali]|uniref:YagK/YfjJ domain-containing protein n=1 Tax=Vreelandella jeotgali TaxID=553386 RepID=UPI0003782D09|nr:inovirus-type Gp2 protein [Halomonas jeotgali]